MSVQAISWALKQRVGNGTAKLVLIALANYADSDAQCWPSQAKIAAECEISIRAVREHMMRLEMVGLLERTERRRDDGSRRTDMVLLKLDSENSQAANPAGSVNVQAADTAAPPAKPAGGPGRLRQDQAAPPAGLVRDKLLLEPTNSEPSPMKRESADALPKPKPRRASRIDPGWPLSETDRRYALEEGVPRDAVDRMRDDFVDWHLAAPDAKGGLKLDFSAAWRRWIRNDSKFNGGSSHGQQRNAPGADAHSRRRNDRYQATLQLLDEVGALEVVEPRTARPVDQPPRLGYGGDRGG